MYIVLWWIHDQIGWSTNRLQLMWNNCQNAIQPFSTVSSATAPFIPPNLPRQVLDCWWLIGFSMLCENHSMWRNRSRRALLSVISTSQLIFCCAVVQELELRWQEYYELVTLLLQWIRHHVVIFEERKLPTSYEEIEVRLYVASMCLR